jgi:hypothetical protein
MAEREKRQPNSKEVLPLGARKLISVEFPGDLANGDPSGVIRALGGMAAVQEVHSDPTGCLQCVSHVFFNSSVDSPHPQMMLRVGILRAPTYRVVPTN